MELSVGSLERFRHSLYGINSIETGDKLHINTACITDKSEYCLILSAQNVPVEKIYGHGGYFKTPVAGQKIMAAALECPVTVMETAGEGGAWGIAVLALFTLAKKNGEALGTLGDYLNNVIFNGNNGSTIEPDAEDIKGFNDYISAYKAALNVEKSACDSLSL